MNEIREIVTKAIVEKGKKTIRFVEKVKVNTAIESVLGCWVLNHSFQAEKAKDSVVVEGVFEVNVWYSFNNNSQTEIVKQMINYRQDIATKRKVKNYMDQNIDVIVRMIQPPVCSDVKIEENIIEIEVLLEVSAEVIGETKMRVSVLDQIPNNDNDDDDLDEEINGQINQQFLREKMF